MVVLLVLLLIISFLTIDYVVQHAAQRRAVLDTPAPAAQRSWRETPRPAAVVADPTELPGGVFVAPGHVWMRVEPSGSVVLGVDRLLLSLLGDVECVYALPEGSAIRRGGPLLMLRRGTRALKIRSPIAGAISKVNQRARRSPGRIARDPFGRGWVYRVSPSGLADSLTSSLVAEPAASWMRGELTRLRDLLQGGRASLVGPTLADGGLPVADQAGRIGDREWEQLIGDFFSQATRASADGVQVGEGEVG